jgi:hypothetical protein
MVGPLVPDVAPRGVWTPGERSGSILPLKQRPGSIFTVKTTAWLDF